MAKKTGSETMGAAGEKSRMTLFKDDRSEDIGAILFSAIVIAVVMVMTAKKPEAAPSTPTVETPPATTAPAGNAVPAKK